MSNPVTLLLARHGDIEGINPPRFRGRADPNLSSVGARQAHELAARIARAWRLDLLLVSPRARCQATAAPLAAATGVEPDTSPVLDDIDYGEWTWRTHQEVEAAEPDAFSRWRDSPELMRFRNGESLQNLLARAADALRLVLERSAEETVALVTHDSVIRALLLQLTGLPLSFYHQPTISPCGISEVVLVDNRARLIRVNETTHLS